MANNRKKWASKQEAEAYALKAEKSGKMGLTYCAACDYLHWDIAARREAVKNKKKHIRDAH